MSSALPERPMTTMGMQRMRPSQRCTVCRQRRNVPFVLNCLVFLLKPLPYTATPLQCTRGRRAGLALKHAQTWTWIRPSNFSGANITQRADMLSGQSRRRATDDAEGIIEPNSSSVCKLQPGAQHAESAAGGDAESVQAVYVDSKVIEVKADIIREIPI